MIFKICAILFCCLFYACLCSPVPVVKRDQLKNRTTLPNLVKSPTIKAVTVSTIKIASNGAFQSLINNNAIVHKNLDKNFDKKVDKKVEKRIEKRRIQKIRGVEGLAVTCMHSALVTTTGIPALAQRSGIMANTLFKTNNWGTKK